MNRKAAVFLMFLFFLSLTAIITAQRFCNRKPIPQAMFIFKDFSEENCSGMVFIERADTSRLRRKAAQWFLVTPCVPAIPPFLKLKQQETGDFFPEYPVDSALFQKTLETLKKMTREELVSLNKNKQKEFNVDSDNAMFFECWDSLGASLGGIYIGKVGPRWDSYYVRTKGTDSVYLVGGSIRFSFFAHPKRWADKSIVKFDPKQAKKLKILSADSGTVELEKEYRVSPHDTAGAYEWYLRSPVKAKANKERVDLLISNMGGLNAVEYEGDKKLTDEGMGFERLATTAIVTLVNGESKTVIIGSKDKVAMKWVRNPEKPNVTFTVYSYTMAGYNPGTAYLIDTTAKDSVSPADAAKSLIEKEIRSALCENKKNSL